MKITAEFLNDEIAGITQEAERAKVVLIKCEGIIEAYKILLKILADSEEELDDSEDLP